MKDSLLELLFDLFEKTIAQLKEQHAPDEKDSADAVAQPDVAPSELNEQPKHHRVQIERINDISGHSFRVFTQHERLKLTKASYQFLMRLGSMGLLSPDTMELIINRLVFSESRFVGLQETKWTIRNALANGLSYGQTAFLDLILYQKEDGLPLH